jgi:hypothetical protein
MRGIPSTLALVVVLALVLPACGSGRGAGPTPPPTTPVPPPSTPPVFWDGFENGLDAWAKGAQVPASPEDPTVPVDWSITWSEEQAFEGVRAARYDIDGRQDDGTIWLERAFDANADTDYTVHVTLMFWSEHESWATTAAVAVFAGATAPTQEIEFDTSQVANRVTGWDQYSYRFSVRTNEDGQVWVALGLTVLWETWLTYYVDDIVVWIDPL